MKCVTFLQKKVSAEESNLNIKELKYWKCLEMLFSYLVIPPSFSSGTFSLISNVIVSIIHLFTKPPLCHCSKLVLSCMYESFNTMSVSGTFGVKLDQYNCTPTTWCNFNHHICDITPICHKTYTHTNRSSPAMD